MHMYLIHVHVILYTYMRTHVDVDVLECVYLNVYVHVDAYVHVELCSYACVHMRAKTLSLNTPPSPPPLRPVALNPDPAQMLDGSTCYGGILF